MSMTVRVASDLIRKLARDANPYEESCTLEWPKYQEAHPDTEETKGQYVQKCVDRKENQQTKREEKRQEEEAAGDAGKGKDEGKPKPKKDEKHIEDMNPEERAQHEKEMQENLGVSEEDAKVLTDADLDSDISEEDLSAAVDSILKKKQPKGDPWYKKMQNVVDTLLDMVDIDDYVMGMPAKARTLADHLHTKLQDNKRKSQENAQSLIEHGIGYEDYVKKVDKKNIFDPPLSRDEWDEIKSEMKAAEKADEAKRKLRDKTDTKGTPPKGPEKAKTQIEKPKETSKPEKAEKSDTKQKKLQPRKPSTQDVIDKSFMPDEEVDYIQGLERNRSISDAEFMRRALVKAPPTLRRRVKDMDPKEFREFYEALWAETQP